ATVAVMQTEAVAMHTGFAVMHVAVVASRTEVCVMHTRAVVMRIAVGVMRAEIVARHTKVVVMRISVAAAQNSCVVMHPAAAVSQSSRVVMQSQGAAIAKLVAVAGESGRGCSRRLPHLPPLVLLHRESPGGVLLDEADAPGEGTGIEVVAVEGGRDQVVVGFDDGLGDPLAVGADVFDLVGSFLADRVLGDFRGDGDPVEAFRQLDAAVGLDREPVARFVEGVDQLAVELEGGLASGDYDPAAGGGER